jgi:hypothetical protein
MEPWSQAMLVVILGIAVITALSIFTKPKD